MLMLPLLLVSFASGILPAGSAKTAMVCVPTVTLYKILKLILWPAEILTVKFGASWTPFGGNPLKNWIVAFIASTYPMFHIVAFMLIESPSIANELLIVILLSNTARSDGSMSNLKVSDVFVLFKLSQQETFQK